jgi:hypothetical protein
MRNDEHEFAHLLDREGGRMVSLNTERGSPSSERVDFVALIRHQSAFFWRMVAERTGIALLTSFITEANIPVAELVLAG